MSRFLLVLLCFSFVSLATADIVRLLPRIKLSVVGVGTQNPMRNPRVGLSGTGFVVADGRHVITNAHVPPATLDAESGESLVVLVRNPDGIEVRRAEKVASDPEHDLLLLKIEGAPLQPLKLGNSSRAREGQQFYFTGYPLGAVLGLYPATSHAGLSAIAPIFSKVASTHGLTPRLIHQAEDPFMIFQLDAIAYPGNSGSPVYDPDSGEVMAVVNSVFVKGSKENAIKDPSGITYAIPVSYVRTLLEEAGLTP